MKMKQDRQNWK